MKTSENGLKKITAYEGKLKKIEDGKYIAYRCPANVPTIYIGCTKGVHDGMVVTEEEGLAMFQAEIEKFEKLVLRLVTVELNQNEFDALVSLAYNIGGAAFERSSVLKRLNKEDRAGAAKAFNLWNKAKVKGKLTVLKGLVSRRASEAALFLKPVEQPEEPYMPQDVAPSRELPSRKVIAAGVATLASVPSLPPVPEFMTTTVTNAEAWKSIGGQIWTLKVFAEAQPILAGALVLVLLSYVLVPQRWFQR